MSYYYNLFIFYLNLCHMCYLCLVLSIRYSLYLLEFRFHSCVRFGWACCSAQVNFRTLCLSYRFLCWFVIVSRLCRRLFGGQSRSRCFMLLWCARTYLRESLFEYGWCLWWARCSAFYFITWRCFYSSVFMFLLMFENINKKNTCFFFCFFNFWKFSKKKKKKKTFFLKKNNQNFQNVESLKFL